MVWTHIWMTCALCKARRSLPVTVSDRIRYEEHGWTAEDAFPYLTPNELFFLKFDRCAKCGEVL